MFFPFLLSIIYCFGHLALALDESRFGLSIGLTLIAIGSGGIKPCVSAHVGDQFGKSNAFLLEKVFSWFYLSINFGAFILFFISICSSSDLFTNQDVGSIRHLDI